MTDINDFTTKIKEAEPFTFVKFGDSEFICMSGAWGLKGQWSDRNSDGHLFTRECGDKLIEAYHYLIAHPRTWLTEARRDNLYNANHIAQSLFDQLHDRYGEPEIRSRSADVDLLLHHNIKSFSGHAEYDLLCFYKTLRGCARPKVYVGPARLKPAADLLFVDEFIEVPLIDAFDEYEYLRSKLECLTSGTIVGFSASMVAKVLIRDVMLSADGPVTCLDFGSAFDSYCGFETRSYQPTPEISRQFFEGIK